MKKTITSILVACGLFLSAFITSSAMAGGWGVGIIRAIGKVDISGNLNLIQADTEIEALRFAIGYKF